MVTIVSPAACANPAPSAAALPKLRRSRTTLHVLVRRVQPGERGERAVRRAVVDVHGLPRRRRAGRGPPGAPRRAARRSAPRCRRARRPRSRRIAYSPMAGLLSVNEALEAVLGARGAARRRVGRASRRRPGASSPRPRGRSSTCRRSPVRPWTASPCAPPTRLDGCRSSSGSPPAGRRRARSQPGEAMGIATGGVVPEGADAVVPIERVDGRRATQVEIAEPPRPARNVRPRGGDVAAGERRRRGRHAARAAQIGALAAAGVGEVRCARRPRVAVLTTGTELRRPGEALAPGEIYESNGADAAAARSAGAGAVVDALGSVADDEAAHRDAIERGLAHDVLVTSGGVSVGPHDLVRRDRGGARRRGGLLGRVREAGQAARLRRPRAHARLRPAGQSRLVPRLQRALRAPRSARAPGRARPGAALPERHARGALRRPTRAATSSSARG